MGDAATCLFLYRLVQLSCEQASFLVPLDSGAGLPGHMLTPRIATRRTAGPVSQSSRTILRSHEQRARVPISPHSRRHLLSSVFDCSYNVALCHLT